jgi:hypothetical protein
LPQREKVIHLSHQVRNGHDAVAVYLGKASVRNIAAVSQHRDDRQEIAGCK